MTDLSRSSDTHPGDKPPKHRLDEQWIHICPLDALPADSGIGALLNQDTADEQQIALFRVMGQEPGSDTICAISNFDPFSKANVLARGILCSVGDELAVASPIGKEHFSLITGQCFEEEDVSIKTYPGKIIDGQVYVQALPANLPVNQE